MNTYTTKKIITYQIAPISEKSISKLFILEELTSFAFDCVVFLFFSRLYNLTKKKKVKQDWNRGLVVWRLYLAVIAGIIGWISI